MSIFAILSTLLFLLCYRFTNERVKPQANQNVNIKDDLSYLIKNIPFLIMAVAGVCTLANVAIRNTVTMYYFKYNLGVSADTIFALNLGIFPLNFDVTTVFMTTGALAFLLGCSLSGYVGKFFGKRNALIILTLVNSLAIISFYFIPYDALGLLFIVNIFASIIAGPTPALVWALYTDVADYNEWKFGRRSTGLIFSATMFAQKFGYTIGASVAASMLSYFGYVANQEQSSESLFGILIMFSLIPGIMAFINGIILFWYPLKEDFLVKVRNDLDSIRDNN